MALLTQTAKFNLSLTLNYTFLSINSSFPSPNQHSLSLYLYIWLTAPKGITMGICSFSASHFWFSHCSLFFLGLFFCLKIKYASYYLCHQYISDDFPWKTAWHWNKNHRAGVTILLLTNWRFLFKVFIFALKQREFLCQRKPDIKIWLTSFMCKKICMVSSLFPEKRKPLFPLWNHNSWEMIPHE